MSNCIPIASRGVDVHDLMEIISRLVHTNSSMIRTLQMYQEELEHISEVIKHPKLKIKSALPSKNFEKQNITEKEEKTEIMSRPISMDLSQIRVP